MLDGNLVQGEWERLVHNYNVNYWHILVSGPMYVIQLSKIVDWQKLNSSFQFHFFISLSLFFIRYSFFMFPRKTKVGNNDCCCFVFSWYEHRDNQVTM